MGLGKSLRCSTFNPFICGGLKWHLCCMYVWCPVGSGACASLCLGSVGRCSRAEQLPVAPAWWKTASPCHPFSLTEDVGLGRHLLGLGQCASMFPCMREPACLSVNVVCARAPAFLRGSVGTCRYLLHVLPSVSVCGRAAGGGGAGSLLTCPGGNHPLSQREQGRGWGEALPAA